MRLPEIQEKYDKQREHLASIYGVNIPCYFCDDIASRRIVHELATSFVLENDYPYDTFIELKVLRHLLVVPKRHVSLLCDLSTEEQQEYWKVLGKYQADGFAVFTRSPRDETASAPAHLHTHLMLFETSTPNSR